MITVKHTLVVVILQMVMLAILLFQIWDLRHISEIHTKHRIAMCEQIAKSLPNIDCHF